MLSATTIDDTYDELNSKFKVGKGVCNQLALMYNEELYPRIQKKYLAHLVASVEDLIDEKIKREMKEKDPQIILNEKERVFFITLDPYPPAPGKKASVTILNKGVLINYKHRDDPRELRILIAHELGHVLRFYKVFLNDDNENHANLFAYIAISSKNKFYKEEVGDLIYINESDIINQIHELCPISEFRQHDDINISF